MVSIRSYEVQLESKVRRKGLGKFLIQILQLIANRCGYECVWFTSCLLNSKAVFFNCSCHIEAIIFASLFKFQPFGQKRADGCTSITHSVP